MHTWGETLTKHLTLRCLTFCPVSGPGRPLATPRSGPAQRRGRGTQAAGDCRRGGHKRNEGAASCALAET